MEKMNRFEFMKNVKLCLDGSSAQYLKMNLLQKKVISAFEKKESFLVISPRQTGRTFSIFFNLLYEIYCNNFLDTIIVTNEVCRTENIVQKVISYT